MKTIPVLKAGAVTLLVILQSLFAAEPQPDRTEIGRAERISDGDTFSFVVTEGNSTGAKLTIRLALVDAPEVQHGRQDGQPWGETSRQYLESLIENRKVRIIAYEKSYGRYVSIVEVLYNGKWLLVNDLIATNGMGEFYKEYRNKYPKEYGDRISASEADAKEKLRGVWVQGDDYVRPETFRHSHQN